MKELKTYGNDKYHQYIIGWTDDLKDKHVLITEEGEDGNHILRCICKLVSRDKMIPIFNVNTKKELNCSVQHIYYYEKIYLLDKREDLALKL